MDNDLSTAGEPYCGLWFVSDFLNSLRNMGSGRGLNCQKSDSGTHSQHITKPIKVLSHLGELVPVFGNRAGPTLGPEFIETTLSG